ncbi:hypothetical protein [Mycolicibacterium peregrinum]|uniref:hypothetical protein n=1 Tax=Mycolicibacterium peregrinum TaxID=43304 RepID=UPI003AAE3970
MIPDASDGEFWAAGGGSRVGGVLTTMEGSRAEVVLDGPLVDAAPEPVSSADSARDVAAFQPITIHGRLNNGVDVTLVNAQNYRPDGRQPRYQALQAVFGAQVGIWPGPALYRGALPARSSAARPPAGRRVAEDGEMCWCYL